MSVRELGVNVWGGISVVGALFCLTIVFWSSFYIGVNGQFGDKSPRLLVGFYTALKENGTVVAGILGFSGLAWATFFQIK